jgi:hypothetical protein
MMHRARAGRNYTTLYVLFLGWDAKITNSFGGAAVKAAFK